MHVDPLGWLVPDRPDDPGVIRIPTDRTRALDPCGVLAVVHHTTDDPPTPDYARRIAERWKDRPPPNGRAASAHMIVDRDTGTIYQLAPLYVGTWHVGVAAHVAGERRRVNACTIGIEWCSAGRLKSRNGEWLCYPYTDPTRSVSDAGVGLARDGTHWHRPSSAQAHTAARLMGALHAWRPGISPADLTRTHAEYDPGRREDPGPLYVEMLAGVVRQACGPAQA